MYIVTLEGDDVKYTPAKLMINKNKLLIQIMQSLLENLGAFLYRCKAAFLTIPLSYTY